MMSKKEVVTGIIKVAFSVIFLVFLHSVIAAYEAIPMLLFWIVAEVVAFADVLAVYNMLIYYTHSDSERIERNGRSAHVGSSFRYSGDAASTGDSQRAVA